MYNKSAMDDQYSAQLADVYDIIYAAGRKDYVTETTELVELIHAHQPGAKSILDVACGTGEHLKHLREHFDDIEGLEHSEPMRAKAAEKLPDVVVHAGDMRDFTLGRTFDVVTCLFSAAGYNRSADELHASARAMSAHLDRGGLLVVDPWFQPDEWRGGQLYHNVGTANGRTVLRMALSARDGQKSRVSYHYLVGDVNGITHFTDVQEMSLFTRDAYIGAIRAAGCERIEFIKGPDDHRGRIVAIKA